MRTLAALLLALVLTLAARAAEPWLKAGDVVALVGGEDMVALAEEGWLETLVTWAQPGDRIRFRSLAWEGDTVFEQRRDLNYPTLETQLDKMGATVVICQFGKMESFAGKEGVAAFTEAYEKLIARLSGEKKRRIALVLPTSFGPANRKIATEVPDLQWRNDALFFYKSAITAIADRHHLIALNTLESESLDAYKRENPHAGAYKSYDGIHVAREDAVLLCINIINDFVPLALKPLVDDKQKWASVERLRTVVMTKNRLWFHYTRPQNWAFLAGNRTNQPSSRDHLDPTKRWFPEEMEQWVPLIEAKEKEIWALAAAPR